MKKRCLLVILMIIVMSFSGCGSASVSNEQSEISEPSASEAVDTLWLTNEGAEMAKDYVENDSYIPRQFFTEAALYHATTVDSTSIKKVGLIVVGTSTYDRDNSTDDTFYWNVKGHFYGEDEYGHTVAIYDFEMPVYSNGVPTSSFENKIDDITVVEE